MVALNESTSEPRLRREARGCRVTAEYPQGGTGIPAGEMNYPGAAAHMRPAAATGFRGVDGPVRLGRCAAPPSDQPGPGAGAAGRMGASISYLDSRVTGRTGTASGSSYGSAHFPTALACSGAGPGLLTIVHSGREPRELVPQRSWLYVERK